MFVAGLGVDALLEIFGKPFWESVLLPESGKSDVSDELLDFVSRANWFGSSAVPAILSEQAGRLNAENAAMLTVKNLLNNLVITILLRLSCERE